MKNIVEMDSGNSCTTMWMCLMPTDCMFKIGQDTIFYVLFISPQLKRNQKENEFRHIDWGIPYLGPTHKVLQYLALKRNCCRLKWIWVIYILSPFLQLTQNFEHYFSSKERKQLSIMLLNNVMIIVGKSKWIGCELNFFFSIKKKKTLYLHRYVKSFSGLCLKQSETGQTIFVGLFW